jgi:hypothetical protein
MPAPSLRRWRLSAAVIAAATLATFAAALPMTARAQALYAGRCAVRNPMLQGTYVGGCIGGWASGQGRAVGQDRYEGEFLDGHASGRGVYTWGDGRRFEGEFRLGRVHGPARFFYANGDVLEGDFRDNLLVGVGRMQRPGGPVQYVELRNGNLVQVAPPAPPVVYAPAVQPDPGSTPTPTLLPPGAPPQDGAAGATSWQPQLDFEDLFPSYLFATATRKPPVAPAAQRSRSVGAQVLALGEGALNARVRTDAPTSRFAGSGSSAAYLGDPWGLIGVSVQSPAPGTRVTVRVTVDEIADATEESFVLPRAGRFQLYPKIRYRYERLKGYTQPAPTNVTWSLTINGQDAGTRTQTTRVRSIQDAPWVVRTARGREEIPWIFAGFVTEDAAWLDDLIREAFAGRALGPIGYQGGADAARAQVRIVYDHLKRRGVKYSSITTTSGASNQVISQIVRFPSDSIRTAQANCIDGSVLLASVLRKIGIEPIIVLVPGHAFMGYLAAPLQDGKDPDVDFIETTMIGSASFDEARTEGLRKFVAASEKDQAELVVIRQARAAGITPIPR